MFILVFIAHISELECTSLKLLKQSVSALFSSLAHLEAISYCTTSVPVFISTLTTHRVCLEKIGHDLSKVIGLSGYTSSSLPQIARRCDHVSDRDVHLRPAARL